MATADPLDCAARGAGTRRLGRKRKTPARSRRWVDAVARYCFFGAIASPALLAASLVAAAALLAASFVASAAADAASLVAVAASFAAAAALSAASFAAAWALAAASFA